MRFSEKNIFLIDSLGALITALLLSQVLIRFESFFGMPAAILWVLSGIAFVFFIYSFICQFRFRKYFKQLLTLIMVANSTYCVVSVLTIVEYFNQLTGFGLAYFIGEILVILLLVYAEYRVLRKS